MRVYTKTGDKGQTGLYDGKRVSKGSVRVEAYGAIDELISYLGLTKCYLEDEEDVEFLSSIQRRLFDVGADLATSNGAKLKDRVNEDDITELEKAIDKYLEDVPNTNTFILPGDNVKSAQLHVARTIARQAERRIINLAELVDYENNEDETSINMFVIKYVNRLSDLLYAMSRYVEINYTEVKFNK
ncbi:MAG: cob(I)yrinic acid a,c-diamide adenosyltransferase [Peptostreptococcaceae bacterium]|nr:cob(I)yrinic acid a,c-diamide adenosyltransferase [Peptostreptococcaceae bacterium]